MLFNVVFRRFGLVLGIFMLILSIFTRVCADFSEAKSIFVLFAHLHDNKDVANGIFEICDIDEDVKNDGVD